MKKQGRLAEMIEEAAAAASYFLCVYFFGMRGESALGPFSLEGASSPDGVGFVAGLSAVDGLSHVSIALVIVYRSYGSVDGYLVEVGAPESDELCIGVGEQPALE